MKNNYWKFIKLKINNKNIDDTFHKYIFNKNRLNALSGYLSLLTRLNYLEKLDKGNYRIIKKIPNGLSTTLANKMLTDKTYQRIIKLEKIKLNILNK